MVTHRVKRSFHGMRHAPEYKVWSNMLSRCTNPNSTYYKNYGGRGIGVCLRWHLFENFLADMGRRPSPIHSIDRINNDGNYEITNCRWVTRKEQALNTSKNVDLTGRIFGRLTVLERIDGRKWKCQCSCGTIKVVARSNLYHSTRSCGCLRSELLRAKGDIHVA